MSECAWTSREACTSDDAPVSCCGPCTQWMARRIKELEDGIRNHKHAASVGAVGYHDQNLWSLLPEEGDVVVRESNDY